jgi:hypothetical protein
MNLGGCSSAPTSTSEPAAPAASPDILGHCHAVLYCKAYATAPQQGIVYAGDIEIRPFSESSCATAMVTNASQRLGELFLAIELTADHQVIDHGPHNAAVSTWSGDATALSFDWESHSFSCVKDDPRYLSCEKSGQPCTTSDMCCSGVCGVDRFGAAACD